MSFLKESTNAPKTTVTVTPPSDQTSVQQLASMSVNGLSTERPPNTNSSKLPTGSYALSPVQNGTKEVTMAEKLQKFYNDLSSIPKMITEETKKDTPNNMSTENLLSVLEDDSQEETQPTKTVTTTLTNSSMSKPPTPTTNVAPAPPPVPKSTRYLYKLKSKTGRVLRYTSDIPITLKKPIITLIKEDEETIRASYEKDQRKNTAIRKKGRPRKNLQEASVVESEMMEAVAESTDSIRTRKRKINFLPDGTIATSDKMARMADSEGEESESEKVAVDTSDEDYVEETEKKKPNKMAIKSKRNSSKANGSPVSPKVPSSSTLSPPVNASRLLSSFLGVNILPSQLTVTRFKPKNFNEKIRSVNIDAARKITLAELKNVVTNNASISSITKAAPSQVLPTRVEPKLEPSVGMQPKPQIPVCIQPKPQTPVCIQPKPQTPVFIQPKPAPTIGEQPLAVPPPPLVQQATAKPTTPELWESEPVPGSLQDILAKFDNFSDSRVVKTREGPKRRITDESACAASQKTLYELFYDVFEALPTWNLHVIPDNNSFCIAQISRGSTGMPVLKKSIELNSDFFAKVYVNQLHCKRYDGIYDTEAKIVNLIKEIDSLAG